MIGVLTHQSTRKESTMAENPFGDADEKENDRRPYLILMSAAMDTASLTQKLLKNIQENIDAKAAPLWIDARGVGIFLSTNLVAWEIRREMLQGGGSEYAGIRNVVIVEIGKDWAAQRDDKAEHWLSTHADAPRPVPYRGGRRN
jgi:hypothetical protein